MSKKTEEYALREIFQNSKWILRRVGGSEASKYATVTQRNYCWQNLKEIKSERDKSACRNSNALPGGDITQVSEIMKRDIQSRNCPWISTTHKDFCGQIHSKSTDWRTGVKTSDGKSKTNDINKLVCSVSHVPPVVRMNCYGDEHFHTTYSHSYVDHNTTTKPPIYEADYDFFQTSEDCAVPYSSKGWTTTYEFDYGVLPQ